MNKRGVAILIVALVGGVPAAVYKWVDESGTVHYGDQPPEEADAQSMMIPEGPSQQEVEQARQQMRIKLEQQRQSERKEVLPAAKEKAPQATKASVIIPDKLECHTQLADVVRGPSGETFTPVRPVPLSKAQIKSLEKLFSKFDGRWQGTITHIGCKGKTSDPESWITKGKVRTNVEWNARESLLSIESDYTGENGAVDRLFHNIKLGSVLYFTEHPTRSIDRTHNETEVLASNQKGLLFFTKPWQEKRGGGALPGAHIRHLEISGRKLKLKELFFHMGMLVDSRTWVLGK